MGFKFLKIGILFTVCLGIIPCANAACTAPQPLQSKLAIHPDAQTYTELGAWFGNHGQYSCALDNLRSALKLKPDSAFLHYLVGLSLFSSGNTEDAISELQQSIHLDPKALKSRLVLADAFARDQRMKDAQEQWRAAIDIDPASTIARHQLASSLIAQEDYGAAVSLLKPAKRDEALSLDLALAYGKAGLLNQAVDTLVEAIHSDPSSLRLTNALTTVYVNQSRFQDAVVLAKKSLQLHPNNLEAQRLYFRVLVLNHDPLARQLGPKLLVSHPHDFEFLYLNGIIYRETGADADARRCLEQAVSLNPTHYNARYNLGLVLAHLNDAAGAKEQFEKALALGDTEPQVRYNLAGALRILGEPDEANAQLKRYQEEMQATVHSSVAVNKSVQAEQEMNAGDPQKAVDLYREAIEATPNDALLNFKLALALDRTGDVVSEHKALDQALQIDPTLAIAQNQIGYLASKDGDFPTAEQHFRLAVQSAPSYTEAWVNLAATLGMESRYPEALEAVTSALKLDPNNSQAVQLKEGLSNASAQH
jgi:Flp pilus assembly protein TadD